MANIDDFEDGTKVTITSARPELLNGLTGSVVRPAGYGRPRVQLDAGQEDKVKAYVEIEQPRSLSLSDALERYKEFVDEFPVYVDSVEVLDEGDPVHSQAALDRAVAAAVNRAKREARSDLEKHHEEWKAEALRIIGGYVRDHDLCSVAEEALEEAGFDINTSRNIKVTLEFEVEVSAIRDGDDDLEDKAAEFLASQRRYSIQQWITDVDYSD